MARQIVTVEKDGFTFRQHNVSIDNGDTKIGVLDVFAPKSLEELASAVDAGVDTEANVCVCYENGRAIQMAAQARAARKGGKIPSAVYDRIFNALEPEFKMTEKFAVINKKIAEVYAAESA